MIREWARAPRGGDGIIGPRLGSRRGGTREEALAGGGGARPGFRGRGGGRGDHPRPLRGWEQPSPAVLVPLLRILRLAARGVSRPRYHRPPGGARELRRATRDSRRR